MKPFIFTVLFAASFCLHALGQGAKHVVLITIDGFRPDFYLDPSWGAVTLQQMTAGGVHAKGVNGVFPTVTFPSHTTLVTGVKPAKHGIYYNDPFEPQGATGKWYWEYSAIKSPTIWDALRQANLTSASVLWPVTAGAPIDYNIPDIWPIGNSDRREITAKNGTPGLWAELEQNATGKLEAHDFNLDKDYLSMDDNVARMAGYLLRKYKPNFTTVHLAAVDHAEHAQGRHGENVRKAVAGADHAIRFILESLEKAGIKNQTAVIVTGDHGFVDRHTNINPNVWLAKAGLIKDLKKDDWKAQFKSASGSTFLHLKDKNDKKTLQQVRQILAALPQSQQKLFRVLSRQELLQAGADPNAVLALAPVPGISFGNSHTSQAFTSSQGGTHGYFPDFPDIQTGFIGYGAGFKKGQVISEMELVDIAPLAAKLLGLQLPAAEGMLYPGIITLK
ncbi:alkaline phosphatase family protein [Rufibacter quisquiliarum]|uniref:Putative AlkP superfamily pyrophosphatase or phosphodiesterase n=1 Tax=Rufibacter quisquiliarum TaxID=1549639 RepID=A0A839GG66_9BACT|nr:ectonucleotide pyrophosphatase/phosphodiesterase [Rufibacter quisquiliarum]MBA9076583.1 putative AlkP superfamily pyrophosphatase or phosphodiesterase [Rufibacter quisquiliarum]